jgi:glutathione reductase (NADPH)
LRGCYPKKVLRRAAEVVDATRLMRRKGVRDPDLAIDWPGLMAFKRTFADPVPASREKAFAEAGIAAFKGTARFVDETTLVVGDDRLRARHVVIASGAKPVPLPIEGAEHVVTSDRFLEIQHLRERVLFIGGGYISFEFTHIACTGRCKGRCPRPGRSPTQGIRPSSRG